MSDTRPTGNPDADAYLSAKLRATSTLAQDTRALRRLLRFVLDSGLAPSPAEVDWAHLIPVYNEFGAFVEGIPPDVAFLEDFLAWMCAQGCTPNVRRLALGTVGLFLRHLISAGVIVDPYVPPTQEVRVPKPPPKPLQRLLSSSEAEAMLRASLTPTPGVWTALEHTVIAVGLILALRPGRNLSSRMRHFSRDRYCRSAEAATSLSESTFGRLIQTDPGNSWRLGGRGKRSGLAW